MLDTAKRVLEIESRAIRALVDRLDAAFESAVERILACRGRVVVTGMGKSGLIGRKISATLSSTGTPSLYVHPAEALHGDLGQVVEGDVVLALSNSGETDEIVRLLERIRRIGAGLIGMSGNAASTLAVRADVHLDVGVDSEACPLDLVPTASTSAALAMGDALAVACYEARGLTARDFARYHPGGRLGRRLLVVGDLMHSGDAVPRVLPDVAMRDAVREISDKGFGVTCVVDDAGALVGVVTDGDLRRLLASGDAEPMARPVAEAMTAGPVTIAADSLAARALNLMESKKITSLPVVSAEGRLDGLIQIHDLWRTELF